MYKLFFSFSLLFVNEIFFFMWQAKWLIRSKQGIIVSLIVVWNGRWEMNTEFV
jgi:hypothetical protein